MHFTLIPNSIFFILFKTDKSVLLIGMGGENQNPFGGMETVSLPRFLNISSKCSKPPSYPFALSGASSVYWHGQVVICGGQTNDGTALTKCYHLKKQDGPKWKFDENLELRKPRAFSASLTIQPSSKDRKEWWITGGRDGHNSLQRGTEYAYIFCIRIFRIVIKFYC